MPSPLSGVGKQVADNFLELGKSVGSKLQGVVGDVTTESWESILSGTVNGLKPQTDQQDLEKQKEKERYEKRKADKVRYDQVKSELSQYVEWKKQMEAKKRQETAIENRDKAQKEAVIKQKKQSFVQELLRKASGGPHGETDRQKE